MERTIKYERKRLIWKVDDLKREIDEERSKNSEETIKMNKLERDLGF